MSLRGEDGGPAAAGDETAEELLERVRGMVPVALAAARAAGGFPGRWKAIAAKLETLPACLSDLSSHPCFAKNALCRELLQSVAATLAEAADLAGRCREPPADGKLRTQSAIDALAGKLDLNLRDCALLVKTGVLSDASGPSPPAEAAAAGTAASPAQADVRELLARLQIGHTEAKNRAVDGLLEALLHRSSLLLAGKFPDGRILLRVPRRRILLPAPRKQIPPAEVGPCSSSRRRALRKRPQARAGAAARRAQESAAGAGARRAPRSSSSSSLCRRRQDAEPFCFAGSRVEVGNLWVPDAFAVAWRAPDPDDPAAPGPFDDACRLVFSRDAAFAFPGSRAGGLAPLPPSPA